MRSVALVLVLGPGVAAMANAGQDGVLDRVAVAVDGAESSHGADPAMWRPDPYGPQGPMQVSEAAASDVGGGDRFDTVQNRVLGRAYLAQLHRRYGNWPDAIAAYNWGIGNLDAWIDGGRPPGQFLASVSAYVGRVLADSGLCDASPTPAAGRKSTEARPGGGGWQPILGSACADLAAGGRPLSGGRWSRFHRKLDMALQLAKSAPAMQRR